MFIKGLQSMQGTYRYRIFSEIFTNLSFLLCLTFVDFYFRIICFFDVIAQTLNVFNSRSCGGL